MHPELSYGRCVDWHRFALQDRVSAIARTVVNRTGPEPGLEVHTRQFTGEVKQQLDVTAKVAAPQRVELDPASSGGSRQSRRSHRSHWSGRTLRSLLTHFAGWS